MRLSRLDLGEREAGYLGVGYPYMRCVWTVEERRIFIILKVLTAVCVPLTFQISYPIAKNACCDVENSLLTNPERVADSSSRSPPFPNQRPNAPPQKRQTLFAFDIAQNRSLSLPIQQAQKLLPRLRTTPHGAQHTTRRRTAAHLLHPPHHHTQMTALHHDRDPLGFQHLRYR